MPGWLKALSSLFAEQRFRFGPSPRVGDLGVAGLGAAGGSLFRFVTNPHGRFLSGFEVFVGVGVGLHEHDVAVLLADRVGGLDVGGDLDRPALGFLHQAQAASRFLCGRFAVFAHRELRLAFRFAGGERRVVGFALLVDLLEAAVRFGAGFDAKFLVVDPQVGFGFGVVVGVHERDRLWRGRRSFGGSPGK